MFGGRSQLKRVAGFAAILALVAGSAVADAAKTVKKEPFVPGIWVDPDGCEHWVMDDGWKGYMDIHLDREGRPVCKRGNICAVMSSDQLFATGSATVGAEGRKRLAEFFRNAKAGGYVIAGHTDGRGSDESNMRLSQKRAAAVAAVATKTGAKVVSATGYGEREPKASNNSAAGMAQNRRVEIFCLR
jgi:outer membrane protein OmpA-like peptidoglycan-associated protein